MKELYNVYTFNVQWQDFGQWGYSFFLCIHYRILVSITRKNAKNKNSNTQKINNFIITTLLYTQIMIILSDL